MVYDIFRITAKLS